MVKIIIYTGLSLSFDEAKEILDSHDDVEVIYKRPIKRGDIGLAINEHPDIIGIIDGVFHQNSAVAHREILKAIDEGITVVGASSMGALRASELDTLGMKGIGYVYEQYATGKVTSDDDVAVMLDSETLEQLSEPLINMEYTFTKAVKENIITEDEKDEFFNKVYNTCDRMNLDEKIEKVENTIKNRKIAIAFSGGADSTLLAYLASKVSDKPIAITIDNHIFPTGFIKHCKKTAKEFGIKHKVIDLNFYEHENLLSNKSDRCFVCRDLMYGNIKKYATARNTNYI